MASNPPLGNRWTVDKTRVDGKAVNIHFNNVDPQFFQTMAIPVLRGRVLERGDKREIVVSESLAGAEWPGENPLGKQFSDTKDIVVGVVGNARLVSPEDSDAVEAYRSSAGRSAAGHGCADQNGRSRGTAASYHCLRFQID